MRSRLLSCFLFFLLFQVVEAQRTVTVQGVVKSARDDETLPGATVSFRGKQPHTVVADASGEFVMQLMAGEKYRLTVSYVGYENYQQNVSYMRDARLTVRLKSNLKLNEVIVTATNGQGAVTTSVIGRDAMAHLQPNSIADLMELLPGGYAKDPNMGVANTIALRETGPMGAYGQNIRDNAFSISSLGTQFVVDGAPINTDANLQFSPLSDTQSISSGTGAENSRNITNRGVDMRSIGTDDIECVEVVRGIPSVEYGNLTSGIVNIKKIRRTMPLTMRFKADGFSKLVSMGKGMRLDAHGNAVLNLDFGFLDSRVDPTNNLENYKRMNISMRHSFRHKRANTLWSWNSTLDYTGSFDNSKRDPDLNNGRIDEYNSRYNRVVFTNTIRLSRSSGILKEIEVNTSTSIQLDRLRQRRLVSPQRYGIVPTNYDDGEHEAGAVFAEYVADYTSDGKPFNTFLKAKALLHLPMDGVVDGNTKLGLTWNYVKNFGDGQLYDLKKPLSVNGWASRPRCYRDIPGLHDLSAFVEENLIFSIGTSRVEMVAGMRLNTIPGLDARYTMHGKIYTDPRMNVRWPLPRIQCGDNALRLALNGGWGVTTKNPTLNYFYPDPYYSNFIELAYYDTHNPRQDSRFVVKSYKQDPVNYALKPARNRKWEVRLDAELAGNSLSVSYFRETMNDGFRYSRVYGVYDYREYERDKMRGGMDWRQLPYAEKHVLDGYQQSSNGSRLVKEGVELQLTSARIKPLRTRINVTGAWFHSIYTNSQAMFDPTSVVVDKVRLSEKRVGLYDWNDGRVNDRLNTNVMFDTQVPEWGLIFTTSAQFMWLVRTRQQWRSGRPTGYLSADDGRVHPFTQADEQDVLLQHLVRHYNEAQFDPFTVPVSMTINLKATKEVGRILKISFFANKIIDYLPSFRSNGVLIRRNVSPYFGVEANMRL